MNIKALRGLFETPDDKKVALAELQKAKLGLLEAQTGAEYARAMVDYQQARIERLTKYLQEDPR